MINKTREILEFDLPKQQIDQERAVYIVIASKALEQGTNLAVFLHLIAQICLKGGMEYIYEMYFALQIVAYLSYYNFDKPPNALKFSEALIKIVEF